MLNAKDEFVSNLRATLSAHVEEMLDFEAQLAEQEVREGWRCVYAQELWFKDNLPPPLINELGRQYSREQLLTALSKDYGEALAGYRSKFLERFFSEPEQRAHYRNYRNVGVLNAGSSARSDQDPNVFDRVANAIVKELIHSQHRHFCYEIGANCARWALELDSWASLTPPLLRYRTKPKKPQRDLSVAIEQDSQYWEAVYATGDHVTSTPGDNMVPEWPLRLMAALAPDFPYSAAHSKKSRLVFGHIGGGTPNWAIIMEKPGFAFGGPRLLLLRPGIRKNWGNSDVLFENVLSPSSGSRVSGARVSGARGIELNLLYLLPRYRRLIRFYQPFVDAAQQASNLK